MALFDLTNLIKSETCFTKLHKPLIDLFLTEKPLSFQKTHVARTSLSNCHKLIFTLLNSYFQKQPPKVFYKKRLFLKTSQYSQENTCVGVSFK